MGVSFVQPSFLGGEWSQTMRGRLDLPAYKIAMAVSLNGLPVAQGSWTRRPGFQYAAHTRMNAPGRLISYNFQQNAPYTMEFTDGYLRFYEGASMAMTNDEQVVVSVSSASPAVVTTTTAHGWSTGDQGIFGNLGTSCPTLHNRQLQITSTGSTTFTITDALTGTAIDGSAIGSVPADATFSRIMELGTPYIGGSWSGIEAVQADSASLLLNPDFAPQVLAIESEPTDAERATFSLAAASFHDGPYLDPPSGGALLTPDGTSGIIGITVSFPAYDSARAYAKNDYCTSSSISYQSLIDQNLNNTPASSPAAWVVVNAATAIGPDGFTSSDIGRHVRLCNEPALWVAATSYTAGQSVSYNGTYYTALASSTGVVPGTSTVSWGPAPQAGVWTWGKIVGLQNQISNNLSGAVKIGNFTNLNNAFDGVDGKTSGASATTSLTTSSTLFSLSAYAGWNFSGASAQKIFSATYYPSTNLGIFNRGLSSISAGALTYQNLQIILRAKQTLPSNGSDGTSLGSYTFPQVGPVSAADSPMGFSPVTIVSNDQATSWNYVWFEVVGTCADTVDTITITATLQCAQVKFFGPAGGSSNGVSLQILGTKLLGTSTIRTWRLGLFNNVTGWPTCGTYHEGRIWIAGSVNNRFDASQPNQDLTGQISFSPTEPDGTVTDASAISYTLNAPSTNTILAMKPDQQGIIAYTERGEWLVQATTINAPLTATNIQAHQVTRIGSSVTATAKPIQCEHTTVFVQRFGQSLMEYFADVFSGKFSAPDIAFPAKHLTGRNMQELAYQQVSSPVIWARCADGSLIGCSYRRETLASSQGPTFSAWHDHSLGGGYTVTSISTGPSADGQLDALAVIANSAVDNTNYVCFMRPFFTETDDLTDAWFLDGSVAATSYTSAYAIGGANGIVINGLWHLNGKTATAFCGGLDCGDWPVANGQMSVPFSPSTLQANTLFTSAFVSAFSGAMPIVVGFTYTSRGQLLPPDTQPESGTRAGPGFGKMRRLHEFAARLVKTQGISFGTSFDAGRMRAAQLRSPGGSRSLAANELFTGVHQDTLQDDYSRSGGQVAWQITRPYPATIAAASGFIETKDE